MTTVPSRAAWRSLALGVWPLMFIFAWAVLPVARLVGETWSALSEGGAALWWSPWTDDYLRARMVWSLTQAGLTTALATLLGVPVAWVLARLHFVGRAVVVRSLMLPFVVPTLVAALGVLALWGPRGSLGLDLADTPVLLILGNLFFNLCLLVRGAMGGLAQVSASRLAAARSLGATPWRAFWRLEWPTARNAVAASACLVFLYCLTGFGLALLLGGSRWATAEVEIYTLVAHDLELGAASVLALWMLLLASLVVGVYAALVVRGRDRLKADGVPLRVARGWRLRAGLAAALAVLLVFNYGPLLALLARALGAGAAAWAHAWSDSAWLALANTLRFSAMGLALAAVLGVLHGVVGARSALWRAWGMAPLVVSPVMVAFGLLLLWPAYLDSLLVLVCAYALLAMPLVAAPVAQAVQTLPAAWLEAARTLGATPVRAFWRVVWPHVLPSVRRGLAFAAATMLGEFAVTLLLSRPEWLTLSTYVYQLLGRPGELNGQAAWVMSAVLMVLSLLAFVVIEPDVNRGEHSA